jgi:hypothetical protein
MTREEFDNYNFSMQTQVMINGSWERILSVDFPKAIIGTNKTGDVTHNQVEAIKY